MKKKENAGGDKKRLSKGIRILLWVVGGVLGLGVVAAAVVIISLNATVYKDAPDIVAAPEETDTVALEPEVEEISEEEYLAGLDDDDELDDVEQNPEDIYEAVEISDRIYNVLVIGDDARQSQDHGRSDTMVLCSYNRDTGDIKFVSFMRDMLVPINTSGTWNRINATYSFGGSGRTINTINRLFALDIQRYVIVRFDSVFALVDEVGGIDVEISAKEAAYVNRIFPEYDQLSEGVAHMNGRQALAFARARKIGNGDFGRVIRQQRAIAAVFEKARTTTSVSAMLALVNFFFENVQTNVPLDEVITMGVEILQNGHLADETLRIPCDGAYRFGRYHGASILKVTSVEDNVRAIHQYLYGDDYSVVIPSWGSVPPMDTPTPTPTESPSPSGSATPTPSGSASPSPSGSATPSPSGTSEPTPTSTPEPTPEPTPGPTPDPSS